MKTGQLDIFKNDKNRWQWQCVFKDRCIIYGFYTYKTADGAIRAARKVLKGMLFGYREGAIRHE